MYTEVWLKIVFLILISDHNVSPGVFDSVLVDTEDGSFPINQLGQVAQKSPHLVMINLSACPQVRRDEFYPQFS